MLDVVFVTLFDFSKVFHVRSVTQGDVIRADAKEIPRIFQLLYAGEGEARRPDEQQLDISTLRGVSADERPGTKIFKGKMPEHTFTPVYLCVRNEEKKRIYIFACRRF